VELYLFFPYILPQSAQGQLRLKREVNFRGMTSEENTDDLLRIKFQRLFSMFQCSAYSRQSVNVRSSSNYRTGSRTRLLPAVTVLLVSTSYQASHIRWFVLAAANYDILSMATKFLK
jgi:hypothetical protein